MAAGANCRGEQHVERARHAILLRMFALRRILIVLLLALSLPVQSYAAAVCAVVHTEPYGNATAEQGSMHHAVPPARVAAKSFDHLSSQCAAYCCIGLALPSEVALEADTVIRAALGPVVDEFIELKRMEWVEYMRHVSDWELRHYLEFF